MSLATGLVKIAIKLTPNIIVKWVANMVLKGIAEMSDFIFDIDARTAFLQVTLAGEVEPIEISVDGFVIISEGDSHQLLIQQAQSNKLWLNNLLSKVVGKPWKIPVIPQYKAQIEFAAELLQAENKL